MRIALLASRELRDGPLSPLQRFARDFGPFLAEHDLITTEGCYRSLLRSGVLHDHPHFYPTLPGHRGGLVQLAEGVVTGSSNPIHAVIYLMDPRDPSANYPEANALKRECVVNKIPFLSTSRSAREWAAQRWGNTQWFFTPVDGSGEQVFRPTHSQGIALVAHDGLKSEMLEFARRNFAVLADFRHRVGTGTTATLLNGTRPEKMKDDAVWQPYAAVCEELKQLIERYPNARDAETGEFVRAFHSGPEGGDVQIANLILDGGCHVIVFFEDPHVARQHEQDILLLERTGRVRGDDVICIHDPQTAGDYFQRWAARKAEGQAEPVLVATALERVFGVKAVLVGHDPQDRRGTWRHTLEAASWVVHSEVLRRSRERKNRGESAHVTVALGRAMADLMVVLEDLPSRLRNLDLQIGDESTAGKRRSLEHPLADDEYLRGENVITGPMQGIMAAADEAVEANEHARRLSRVFGGVHVGLPMASVLRRGSTPRRWREERFPEIDAHWKRTDVLVTSCGPVRVEMAAPTVREYSERIARQACGIFAGIPLRDSGVELRIDEFERIGMDIEEVKATVRRGGSILVVGGETERVTCACAALEAGLVSIFVSDVEFARSVLASHISRSRPGKYTLG